MIAYCLRCCPLVIVSTSLLLAGRFASHVCAEEPFFRLHSTTSSYAGPTDNNPATDVDQIQIAFFGPYAHAPEPMYDAWRGAQLAIKTANDAGGFQGKPFRLRPIWSKDPWSTGVAELTRLVYSEPILAIVGGIDGPSTHLAEQVVAKARLPLISPLASDKTINLANVPWMFSCVPTDTQIARAMAGAIRQQPSNRRWILISATDHDSQLLAIELLKQLEAPASNNASSQKRPTTSPPDSGNVAEANSCGQSTPEACQRPCLPAFHFQCEPESEQEQQLVDRAMSESPSLVAIVADAAQSLRLVRHLRTVNPDLPIVGGPHCTSRTFRESASPQCQQIAVPVLWPVTRRSESFKALYQERYGHRPDWSAAYSYDSVCLLVTAIRAAGLNRASIRDAIFEQSPWSAVTGSITWDGLGSNLRNVSWGHWTDGRIVVTGKESD